MDLAEMQAKIAETRHRLKINSAGLVYRTKDGPIGIELIEDLLALLESQDRRIKELERHCGLG